MKTERSKNQYRRAYVITLVSAWFFCIVPTMIAGAVKLPLVVAEEAGQTLTGSAIIVLACCAYPIFKGLLKALKSPSAWLIMWIVALITLALYRVPHETLGALSTVFTVAAIGNTVGAVLFRLSKIFKEKQILYLGITAIGGYNE